MRFKLYREYGALNSVPVFTAFEQGVKSLGHEIVTDNEDVSVIWSVLWAGKMANNQKIYQHCLTNKKPILIIEVGNLNRGHSWRLGLNHINNLGNFANTDNLDPNRPTILGVSIKPLNYHRSPDILIAAQHELSLQWQGMPSMRQWCESIVKQVQHQTSRKIVVRPHPRSPFSLQMPNVKVERPQRITNTYDDFDISYKFHCVINYNSGPAVQAAISGIPVLCDSSSLASDLSIKWEDLENPTLPDREDWFLKLCHTEWTVKEICQGIPLARLLPEIQKQLG
jgi:hypothetical protein